LGPIPNPQSPIPNPHPHYLRSEFYNYLKINLKLTFFLIPVKKVLSLK
jgi:hypothetical protein